MSVYEHSEGEQKRLDASTMARERYEAKKKKLAGKKLGKWTKHNTESKHGWSDSNHHASVNAARVRIDEKRGK